MCGLPPGESQLLSPVVMVNLLGDIWPVDWAACLSHTSLKLHLYGKEEARQGRKMGHFNLLATDIEQGINEAAEVFRRLSE
jgi:5-(carboxyamino)imidazole ribonucleotide synthase